MGISNWKIYVYTNMRGGEYVQERIYILWDMDKFYKKAKDVDIDLTWI